MLQLNLCKINNRNNIEILCNFYSNTTINKLQPEPHLHIPLICFNNINALIIVLGVNNVRCSFSLAHTFYFLSFLVKTIERWMSDGNDKIHLAMHSKHNIHRHSSFARCRWRTCSVLCLCCPMISTSTSDTYIFNIQIVAKLSINNILYLWAKHGLKNISEKFIHHMPSARLVEYSGI